MTRPVHRYSLKDETNTIGFPLSDHLRNHVHLTNCIHLKNHMHRQSPPILSERSLIRDLIALQRSRSLRDPSASPPSWLSPSLVFTPAAAAAGRKPVKDGSGSIDRMSSRVDNADVGSSDRNVEDREEVARRVNKSREKSNARLKTLSERLDEPRSQTDNDSRRNSGQCSRHRRMDRMEEHVVEEPEASSGFVYCNGLKRMKRSRFRGARRRRVLNHADLPVDPKRYVEEEIQTEVSHAPRNGCGIPWNWSRIHNRGKSFLDIAGRSLSCGLPDSRRRKGHGPVQQSQKDVSRMPVMSDRLTSSTDSESEALPLLIEPLGSQESNEDYSGELGLFVNDSSRQEQDSDLASEARSGSRHRARGRHGMHRSLTQKYMPKTFKDLVGQNLVVQALSNAVLRRKVGLIYVFYGPHGTGKTSCARVFAKALNCQSMEHPKPCNLCTSCISHNLGKSRNVMEVGPVSAFDYENIMEDVLDKAWLSPLSSQYRVFIVDDCDTLPPDAWSAISKVIDRAPRHVVFVLVSSNLDHLPHIIISRCQKFFFPKLKDSDIIYTLQLIATSEGLQIDKDALKLIASRSDGSLRDAEMTLDQLSLLGQKVSLPLVQELIGLVSDEKLVDLLDLALSADTVNTVKSLREIMETGVEPLALMSQLATIITDILAGSYVFTRERLRRKFFRRLTLSKEDMEKLRQALKTLSEAEKQLRVSNDKLTWLTAAMLQLAPDQQYMLPTSSRQSSLNHSPMALNNTRERDLSRISTNERDDALSDRELSRGIELGYTNRCTNGAVQGSNKITSSYVNGKRDVEHTPTSSTVLTEAAKANGGYKYGKIRKDIDKIWKAVLENIQSDTLKQFMFQEGKLTSVSLGAAPTVQLIFSSPANKAKAEKFRGQILEAFESALHSGLILEIRCESRMDMRQDVQTPLHMVASENGSQMGNRRSHCSGSESFIKRLLKEGDVKGIALSQARRLQTCSLDMAKDEITEIEASPQEHKQIGLTESTAVLRGKGLENGWLEEASTLQSQDNLLFSESREREEQHGRRSLVKGKVSLAHVIQQAEGSAQHGGWSRRKAISIAEKLEQENLRLEPRSRRLLCWRVPRITRRKLPHLRIRTRKSQYLLKIVTCGRCLRVGSPR